MFWKKLPLPPLSNGERDFWATVCARLASPVQVGDDPHRPAVGYFRNFGMRLGTQDPQRHLELLIQDGRIHWEDSDISEVEPGKLNRGVRKHITEPDSSGIWYRSGRIFYPKDDSAG